MLEIDRRFFGFRRKDVWFSERPFDIEGCHGVMFYSCSEKADARGFSRRDFPTIVIDLTRDEDALWKSLDKWERKKINKAGNNGAVVRINRGYREFHDIYRAFRRGKGLVPWSLDPEFMQKYGTLFVAELGGEIVGGHFFLHDADRVRGLVTGSKRLEVDRARANIIGYTNRLIIWEAIRHFKAQGMREYDMGGYYAGQNDKQLERINEVKAGFGGEITMRYHYEKDYSKLFRLARQTYEAGMVGLYRNISPGNIRKLARGVRP